MIEGDLKRLERLESVSFPHRQFRLQIHALHGPAGERASRREPVHNQRLVAAGAFSPPSSSGPVGSA